jgi:intracellular septation protein A
MDWSILLLDLIPVLIFVVFDSLGKVKYAVIGAVLAAALELSYSYFFLGGVDGFSLIYVTLFLIFGGLSYKFNNPVFFKFKPVVVSTVSALIFLVTYANGTPLMVLLMDRYAEILPAEAQALLSSTQWRPILARVSFYMIFGLVAHAGLVAWVALRSSTWWWLVARNAGFIVIAYLVVLVSM